MSKQLLELELGGELDVNPEFFMVEKETNPLLWQFQFHRYSFK